MKLNVLQNDNCPLFGYNPEDLVHFLQCLSQLGHPQDHIDDKCALLASILNFVLIPHDRNSKETFADIPILGNNSVQYF